MKVCHVTSAHRRHDLRICEKECVSLSGCGYDVFLVVNDLDSDEEYKGVHIISTGKQDKSILSRTIRAPKRVLRKALEIDADIYHLHDPELLSISDRLLDAGKKVIFDAHEDYEKLIDHREWIPELIRPVLGRVYSGYFRDKLQRMSAVISVTPSIVKKYSMYNSNIVMITNYPIIDEDTSLTEDLEKDGRYVFFAGGIWDQWCHERIIEAVNMVENVSYRFAGVASDEYLAKLRMRGENWIHMGMLPHKEVMGLYKGSIAGMAVMKSDTQVGEEGTLGNTKLFEVMRSGRPVICSDLLLWREIIDKYSCGICVDPDDARSIADAIRYLADNPDEADNMGENGRKAVETEYNWSSQEKTLLELYKRVEAM